MLIKNLSQKFQIFSKYQKVISWIFFIGIVCLNVLKADDVRSNNNTTLASTDKLLEEKLDLEHEIIRYIKNDPTKLSDKSIAILCRHAHCYCFSLPLDERRKLLTICLDNMQKITGITNYEKHSVISCLARAEFSTKEFKKAEKHMQEAVDICIVERDKEEISRLSERNYMDDLYELGRYCNTTQHYQNAEKYLKEVLALAKKNKNSFDQFYILSELVKSYQGMGETRKANETEIEKLRAKPRPEFWTDHPPRFCRG